MENIKYDIKLMCANGTEYKNFILDRPYGTPDYLFIHFKSCGVVVIDKISYEIKRGDCILYTPNTPHYFYATQEIFCHDWVHFDVDNDNQFNNNGLILNKIFRIENTELLSNLILSMHMEYINKSIHYKSNLSGYFSILFVSILRDLEHPSTLSHHMNSLKEQFTSLRVELYRGNYLSYKVEQLSKIICMSRTRFTYLYTLFFYVSPKQDLINAKIERAMRLLNTTDYKLKDIAMQCGYSNEFNFIRQFKKLTGNTPDKWRRV